MRKALLLPVLFLSSCSPVKSHIKHLSPQADLSDPPPSCVLVGILPGSPAQVAGLNVGETIQKINGAAPSNALAVAELLDKASAKAELDVLSSGGQTRKVTVVLNKERPRLGASCSLDGWRQKGVSSVGNESLTVYDGPYVLTVSGIFDKGLAFMRVRVSNHTDRDLAISSDLFSATDGQNASVLRLSPVEVLFFLHGQDAVSYLKPPEGNSVALQVPAQSPVRQLTVSKKTKKEWSRAEEEYIQTNASYLSKESFWPQTLKPGQAAEGLIYFIEPASQPFTVKAQVQSAILQVTFGDPQPSSLTMTQDELIRFFNGLKKGAAVRLTLKTGKVFSGKYSSYDDLNETVWFDTPSGSMLMTSSFGLRSIRYAETLSPVRK